ncbi:MAG TPA: OsmC family protein [Actinomycetota bacterium]|nr:OsmC family protein [Actinomycetota bacterium]
MRTYEASAVSTGTFGRVLASSRGNDVLVDGPPWNGCLGEKINPGELFLAAVASCGVELVEVIARDRGLALRGARVEARGELDPENRVRDDLALFNRVSFHFTLEGVSDGDGMRLVESFKGR